jgi:hypothetical protein
VRFKNSPILVESLMNKKPIDISSGPFHSAVCCGKYNIDLAVMLNIPNFRRWRGLYLG